jgi:cytidylate kinase
MEYTKVLICGKRCTGKTTLFWDLQKTLNWPTFTVSQYLRDYIHRFHLSAEQMDERSETVSHDIEDRVAALLTSTDRVIIDSRVYGRLKEVPPNVLKVLLTASDQARVIRAAYREKTTPQKQQSRLIPRESEWIEKMQKLYPEINFFDPTTYDLAIDTSMLTPQNVLDQVVNALKNSKLT